MRLLPERDRTDLGWRAGLALATAIAAGATVASLRARESARADRCDALFVALRPEVARELRRVLADGQTACGSGTISDIAAVVACTFSTHLDEDDPRDPRRAAYVPAAEAQTSESSCQVGLEVVAPNAIRFHQWRAPGATQSRTFRVSVD